MNWGIFGIRYARIMFLACYHLICGAAELSEIHILLKMKLEWIDYILIDYNFISLLYRKEAKSSCAMVCKTIIC